MKRKWDWLIVEFVANVIGCVGIALLVENQKRDRNCPVFCGVPFSAVGPVPFSAVSSIRRTVR